MRLSHVALAALIASAVGGAMVAYAAAPGPVFIGTAKEPISVKAGDYELVAQAVELAPGGMIPKHSHPGYVVVQVLTGELTLTDATGSKTVKAGGMFAENPGSVHWAVNSGSVTARMAVSYLVPKGAQLFDISK